MLKRVVLAALLALSAFALVGVAYAPPACNPCQW